ncbi:hypothetical protein [Streptomyces sp. NPDC057939]|uniref:hypothetical protein n=1 Tax=Streptomyces sp. NPDC057939 TaxID=3346284 RepID=UPI0036F16D11
MRRRIIATVVAGAAGLTMGLLPVGSASAAVTGGGGGGGGGGGWCDSRHDDCCDRNWDSRYCGQGVGGWYEPDWRDNDRYYNSNYYDANWRGNWNPHYYGGDGDRGYYYYDDGDHRGGWNDGWGGGYRYND